MEGNRGPERRQGQGWPSADRECPGDHGHQRGQVGDPKNPQVLHLLPCDAYTRSALMWSPRQPQTEGSDAPLITH